MLKIKDEVDLKELEKFGFKKFNDRFYHNYFDRGSEDGYELDLGSVSYEVIEKRNNWKWRSSINERVIDMQPNDYDMFPKANDFDIIFDLIEAGLIEKVEDSE